MKMTKTFLIFGFLAAFQLASVGLAEAGDPYRVRCEVRSGKRAKIDVDVRDLVANSTHQVTLTRVAPANSCSQTFSRSADAAGELDLRTDTNVNDENNLDGCFKVAQSIQVLLDGNPLGGSTGVFQCTAK